MFFSVNGIKSNIFFEMFLFYALLGLIITKSYDFKMQLENDVVNMIDMLPCILNITKNFKNNTNFVFIMEEIRSIESIEILLKNLDGKILIKKSNNFEERFGFFILFPDYYKQYRNILTNIKPFVYNRFLIIWCRSQINSKYMIQFMSQFWEFKLVNVIILHKKSVYEINIYSYDPYTRSICNEPSSLILTDIWNIKTNSFKNNKNLYGLAEKLNNLDGCKLICFAKTRPPDAVVKQISSNEWQLEGIGGKLMEEVRKRINFTSVIHVPKLNVSVDKYGYDISDGFPQLVAALLDNSSVDLAFGIYSHIIYDNSKVEFSIPTVSECWGWAVPSHAGKVIPMWMYYTQEFSLTVWILILFEFCFSICSVYCILRFYYDKATEFKWINFVTLHLGMSTWLKIKYTKIRIIIGIIILYSLVTCSAYQSSLGSFLAVPWKQEQIKSYKEILEINYTAVGVPQAKRILERFSKNNRILNKLSGNFEVHKDYFEKIILHIQRKKDTVTFGAKRFLQFYIKNELPINNQGDIYFLPNCVVEAHASPFLFKKASPFLKPINRIILAAIESGLIDFWFTYSTPKIRIKKQDVQAFSLTLYQMKCAFGIIIIGNSIALIIFIFELKTKSKIEKINRKEREQN